MASGFDAQIDVEDHSREFPVACVQHVTPECLWITHISEQGRVVFAVANAVEEENTYFRVINFGCTSLSNLTRHASNQVCRVTHGGLDCRCLNACAHGNWREAKATNESVTDALTLLSYMAYVPAYVLTLFCLRVLFFRTPIYVYTYLTHSLAEAVQTSTSSKSPRVIKFL